ncbi:MAG TPA: hypothetical protein VK599_16595, partial [Streptosporangiaceae bacterium]|nr:hypothetical protein [Streptosporangiaceae bacterium]
MSVHEVVRKLAGIQAVRDRSRAMAMLDAVLCREWGYRYYSFDRAWSAHEPVAVRPARDLARDLRHYSGGDVFDLWPLTPEVVSALNPLLELKELR